MGRGTERSAAHTAKIDTAPLQRAVYQLACSRLRDSRVREHENKTGGTFFLFPALPAFR